MACTTSNQPVFFDEFNGFAQKVYSVIPDPKVPYTTMYEGTDSPVINRCLNRAGKVIGLRISLGNPLNLSSPFISITVVQSNGWVLADGVGTVDRAYHCVDTTVLAYLPCLNNLTVGEVVSH
jgi:hypothetical protein